MEDDLDFQKERPLDFSQHSNLSRCPYCAEEISSEELDRYLASEGNSIVCPNCRKRLNIHELGM
ncbi:MAG: hypothetical protein ABIA63_05505 [bacterium]